MTHVPSGVASMNDLIALTGEPSPVETEPSECQSKRGVAFDFKDGDDLDALAPGMSWW